MKNRTIGYLITVLACVVFFQPSTAGIVSLALVVAAELMHRAREGWRERIKIANRRDCIVIAEEWPYGGSDGPKLSSIFEGLYEYHKATKVEGAAAEWYEDLIESGNQSVGDDLPEDLQLPILTIYSRKGANRMETREQYGKRIERMITENNTAYHAALELENEGKNYLSDYILRR